MLRVTPELLAAVKAKARAHDVSMSHIVRASLRAYLGQEIGGTKK